MRIFFAGGGTGGHLYPGLAIARALMELDPTVSPFFIGAERGIEREILPTTGFPHELLDLHPLYRTKPWENRRTAAGLWSAWRTIGRLVSTERPAVAVGTGGYASGATLAYAAAHRIPVVIQEQNSYPGITTRLLSRVAREIYLGYGEAASHLHPRADAWVGDLGNPITPPPPSPPDRGTARALWGFPETGGRVLLIVGGSQGARAVNAVVGSWIDRGIPDDLYVIWATGRAGFDAFARHESARVRVRRYLSPIEDAYAAADVALARAGALTLAELCAWGIPPILVPLPTAAADHQSANARALADVQAAILVYQRDLTVDVLDRTVRELLGRPQQLQSIAIAARARARPNAAENIARRILSLAYRRGKSP